MEKVFKFHFIEVSNVLHIHYPKCTAPCTHSDGRLAVQLCSTQTGRIRRNYAILLSTSIFHQYLHWDLKIEFSP